MIYLVCDSAAQTISVQSVMWANMFIGYLLKIECDAYPLAESQMISPKYYQDSTDAAATLSTHLGTSTLGSQ